MSNKTSPYTARFCETIFLILFLAVTGFSQELAEIAGTVKDSDGFPIPNAVVAIRQQETMLVRSTHSADSGTYFIDRLPIGTYTIEITYPGFTKALSKDVRLFVGEIRTVDATLEVAGPAREVVVLARASEVDQTSAALGGRVEQKQLMMLPLNGRNWASLLPLIPGATDSGTTDQRSVRFAGHGRDDNNFTFDGVDATGISNQPQKSGIRIAIPTSTIMELKVDSALFTAESGNGTGGQVTMASVGGTNTFHGTAFDFLRNDVFDARNPFAQTKQPFRLNQFGATFGGPVIPERTFLFLAFEGLRQRLGQTLRGFVPSSAYRAQALASDESLRPLINAYPTIGTQAQANDAKADLFVGLSPQRVDESSGMVRVDHRFTAKTSAFLRFNVDKAINDVPLGNLRDRQETDNRLMNGVVSVTRVLSANALNEAKLGFNQALSRTTNKTGVQYGLVVPGFTSLSSSRTREEDDTSVSLLDHLSVARGRHAIKLGFELRRIFMDPGGSADGSLTYTNRDTFLLNQLDSASVTAALPLKRLRKTQVFSFIQDEYKITPTFTFNMGLRYQFFNVFHEADGRAVPFDFATCGGFCEPGSKFSEPRKTDFDPRVSFAWAPEVFRGRTVLRSGFGIYHGDGQLEDQNLPASNDVSRYSLNSKQISGLRFPIDSFLATAQGIVSPRAQNRRRKDEYSSQWSLSIQQQLPAHFVGTISYSGNKGTNLQTITYRNVIDPVTGARPFPQYGQVEYRTNDSNSTFHALQLSVQRALRSGWLFAGSYMWSHAINDGSLGGGEADAIAPQNVFCRSCERASSAQDIRHFFSANSVYELPFGTGKRHLSEPGAMHAIFGGWSLSGIAIARSGRPVNITIRRSAADVPGGYTVSQRPDVIPGVSLIPTGGRTITQWINAAAFRAPAPGTLGNAGRNLGRGPSLAQLDIGLTKHFPLGEHSAVEFRSEIFNVFNRSQYGDPSGDITVPAQFGIIQSTINTTPIGTGTPRQVQFMLRVSF